MSLIGKGSLADHGCSKMLNSLYNLHLQLTYNCLYICFNTINKFVCRNADNKFNI